MEQLGQVLKKTNWAEVSATLNSNSDKVYEAVTQLEQTAFKNQGYFADVNALKQLVKHPVAGMAAYVRSSSTSDYYIYEYNGSQWVNTNSVAPNPNVSTDKINTLESKVSRMETLTNNNTTNTASNKAKIDAHTADIATLKSQTAGLVKIRSDIETLQNTASSLGSLKTDVINLQQKNEALSTPQAPLFLNDKGSLGLKFGAGLVMRNGYLESTGGGGGGGISLNAGTAIEIKDNTISVNYAPRGGLMIIGSGLAIGTGHGFNIGTDGRLQVVIGSGLAYTNDGGIRLSEVKENEIKNNAVAEVRGGVETELNTLKKMSDRIKNMGYAPTIQTGVGLSYDGGVLKVNTSILGELLVYENRDIDVDSYGKLFINHGDSLIFTNDKLEVNPQAAVAFRAVRDGLGQSIHSTYATKAAVEKKQDKLIIGTGLETDDISIWVSTHTIAESLFPSGGLITPDPNGGMTLNIGQGLAVKSGKLVVDPYTAVAGQANRDLAGNVIHTTYAKVTDMNKKQNVLSVGTGLIKNGDSVEISTSSLFSLTLSTDSLLQPDSGGKLSFQINTSVFKISSSKLDIDIAGLKRALGI